MTAPGVHQPHAGRTIDGSTIAGGRDAMGNPVADDVDRPHAVGLRLQTDASTDGSCPERTAHGADGCRRVWRLPATESSVTSLRRGLNDLLCGAGLSGDERYDLLLAVCEAVSNAIEHARNPSEPFIDVLSEFSDGQVTIVVRDYGQWCDRPPGPHRGRGLAMMWLLADTAVAASPLGTTVTIRSCPRHGRSSVSLAGEGGAADGSPFPSSAVGGV